MVMSEGRSANAGGQMIMNQQKRGWKALSGGLAQPAAANSTPQTRQPEGNCMNTYSSKSTFTRSHNVSIGIRRRLRTVSLSFQLKLVLCVCAMLGLALTTGAQTLICGNITTTTWTPAGNPHIVGCDSTVPSGNTLTIQPGVIVWLASNVSLTVNGSIQAVGIPGANPANRITFQAPVPSLYWNRVQLNYSGATNRFKYCDFGNAQTAISMFVFGYDNPVMSMELLNCTFSNCVAQAIYGNAQGYFQCCAGGGGSHIGNGTLRPVIKNCVFDGTGNGCVMDLSGTGNCTCGGVVSGHADPAILNNIFRNLSGSAFLMTVGSYGGSGRGNAVFMKNTLINCRTGIAYQDPWMARIEDNIFLGSTNAAIRTGSLSVMTSYNDFYGNATNFTGYPPSYGQWIIPNRNGTLADLSFNISQDPQFVGPGDFHLANGSACIDAGTPDTAFCDLCLSNAPSHDTQFPDLGAYGGSDACNWLHVVPKLPVTASMSKSNNVIRLNWGAIPRSEYQVQYVTNLALIGTNNWLNQTNGRVFATEKPTSLIVVTNTMQRFFRIQSLGRTPGN